MAAAEDAKREIASAVPLAEERTLRIAVSDGDDLVVSSVDVATAVGEWLRGVDEALGGVLADTPGELRADLEAGGVVLAGGGAQLRGLDRHVTAVTGLPATVAVDPTTVVARGTGAALDSLEVVRRTFLYVR